MAWRREDLEDHIATLEEFETRYGEFLVEHSNRDHNWSGEEWARRERELQELAPQAEAAMVAAGGRRWDESPMRINPPSRIQRLVDDDDGIDHAEHWRTLEELPKHLGALKGKLRRAPRTPDASVEGRYAPEGSDADAQFSRRAPTAPQPSGRSWWRDPNPWVLYIGAGLIVTVVGGIAVALILAA